MALECLCELVYYLIIIAAVAIVVATVVIYFTSDKYPDLSFHHTEKTFYHSTNKKDESKFPSIKDGATLDITVVVPAYNEEKRLPIMLDEAMEFLETRKKKTPNFTYEVIVVDDGSKDATTKVALTYTEKYGPDKVRVMTLYKNRGKGGAVRQGMLVGRGKKLLFADADGASQFSDVEKLEEGLDKICENGFGVVCGSRAHLEEDSIAQRSFFRTILMHGFHFLVWFLCVRGVKDTQCGFKLLSRQAADILFSNLHVNRWAFDVDLLYLALYFKMPIGEVAVKWAEIEGSKMVPVFSWIEMGIDILLIRWKYIIGAWRIQDLKSAQ